MRLACLKIFHPTTTIDLRCHLRRLRVWVPVSAIKLLFPCEDSFPISALSTHPYLGTFGVDVDPLRTYLGTFRAFYSEAHRIGAALWVYSIEKEPHFLPTVQGPSRRPLPNLPCLPCDLTTKQAACQVA